MSSLDTAPGRNSDPAATMPGQLPTELLEHKITQQGAQIAAATCVWLGLIAEYERREGWRAWGTRSCAHWLSWFCGLDLGTAREHVRVALALADLPEIGAMFSVGRLSYSKVRALTRVATPETEPELVEMATVATAAQLTKILTAFRRHVLSPTQLASRFSERSLDFTWDDDGCLVVRARLEPDDGAAFLAAVRHEAERLRDVLPRPERDASADAPPHPTMTQLRADALMHLVRGDAAGAEIVVHTGPEPRGAYFEDGPAADPATVERLFCDASTYEIAEDADGGVLDVSRKSRTTTTRLHRALQFRDPTCRWPGCAETRHLHAHHIRFWSKGWPHVAPEPRPPVPVPSSSGARARLLDDRRRVRQSRVPLSYWSTAGGTARGRRVRGRVFRPADSCECRCQSQRSVRPRPHPRRTGMPVPP